MPKGVYKPLQDVCVRQRVRRLRNLISYRVAPIPIDNSNILEVASSSSMLLEPTEVPTKSTAASLESDYPHSEESSTCDMDENDLVSDESLDEVANEFCLYDFKSQLSQWALGVTHHKVTELLMLLKQHKDFSSLPSDCRTLLKTPRQTEEIKCGNGSYCHMGIAEPLERIVVENKVEDTDLKLQINVDGLPLAKSSGSQVWPILIWLYGFPHIAPFTAGVYHGQEKPRSIAAYLQPLVDDVSGLIQNGLCVGQKLYNVICHSFVCDVPARAFITQTKCHTGYSSCSKCYVEGEYMDRRVTFLETKSPLRSDESFTSRHDDEYHVGTSPLEQIPGLKMVSSFPIDYMHCMCLGVARKFLIYLLKGNIRVKLQAAKINAINSRIEEVIHCVPSEFSRKPRSLKELLRWKATEFRLFLLYIGPYLLNEIVPHDVFVHFLCFHVASRILSSTKFIKNDIQYANELLHCYVQNFGCIYGQETLSYNVHSLLHIAADAERFGILENFSASRYENKLQAIKKLVRKPGKPLPQIVRRLTEISHVASLPNVIRERSDCEGKLLSSKVIFPAGFTHPCYSSITWLSLKVSTKKPDNCVIMDSGEIVVVNFIGTCNDKVMLLGSSFEDIQDFYNMENHQIDSKVTGIFKAKNLSRNGKWLVEKVRCKALMLPLSEIDILENDTYYIAEYLHS